MDRCFRSEIDFSSWKIDYGIKTKLITWIINISTLIIDFDLFKVYYRESSLQPQFKRYYSEELAMEKKRSTYIIRKLIKYSIISLVAQFSFRMFISPLIAELQPTNNAILNFIFQSWSDHRIDLLMIRGIFGFFLMSHIITVNFSKLFYTASRCPDPVEVRFMLEPTRELWRQRKFIESKLDDYKCLIEAHRRLITRESHKYERETHKQYFQYRDHVSMVSKLLDDNYQMLHEWNRKLKTLVLHQFSTRLYKQLKDWLPSIIILSGCFYVCISLIFTHGVLQTSGLVNSCQNSHICWPIYQTNILIIYMNCEFLSLITLYYIHLIFQECSIIFIKRDLNSCLLKMRLLYARYRDAATGDKFISYSLLKEANQLLFETRINLELRLSDLKRCSKSITLLLSSNLLSSIIIALLLNIVSSFITVGRYELRMLSFVALTFYHMFAIQSAHVSGNLNDIQRNCWYILAEGKYLLDRDYYDSVFENFTLKIWRQYIMLLDVTRDDYAARLFDIRLTYGMILKLDFFFCSLASIIIIHKDSLV